MRSNDKDPVVSTTSPTTATTATTPTTNKEEDDADDVPSLSLESMTALLQFYDDQKQAQIVDEDICSMPSEDWQLSQFWLFSLSLY